MFKVRMQGQYGSASDKQLWTVAKEMWGEWGFTRGIMRRYWISFSFQIRYILSVPRVSCWSAQHVLLFMMGLDDIVCCQAFLETPGIRLTIANLDVPHL